MSRSVRSFSAAAVLLALTGCAMAPRSGEVALASANSSPADPSHAEAATRDVAAVDAGQHEVRVSATPGTPPQSTQSAPGVAATNGNAVSALTSPSTEPTELLALVQSLRSLTPAEQDQLVQDLKQTDPRLWPLVTQQFKASLEYRQRASGASQASASLVTSAPTVTAASQQAVASPVTAAPVSGINAAATAPVGQTSSAAPSVLPVSTTLPAAMPAPSDWRQPLSAAIASVEQSLRESPGNDDRQIYLRLLHLIAGHRDRALELVAGREPTEQEFWSKELYALSTLWDASRQPDQGKRRTEAAIHFDEANGKLRELGLLTIRNLAFCTEVNSYGVYKRFEKDEFRPDERVLLYAELENFVSQATPQGYHTSLKASYQIFDSRGAKVEEQELPPMEEYCQNPRRDFFVAYSDMRLPKQIYDGRYTLKLSIEDTLGKKIAQSSIELTIKSQPTELATR